MLPSSTFGFNVFSTALPSEATVKQTMAHIKEKNIPYCLHADAPTRRPHFFFVGKV